MGSDKEEHLKGLFAIWFVVCLALMVGTIYVVVHFITKFW